VKTIHCYVINLAPSFGGGEAYTHAYTKALLACNISVTLYVRQGVEHWKALTKHSNQNLVINQVADVAALRNSLPKGPVWIITHSPTSNEFLSWANNNHYLTGFAHMPAFGRDLRPSFKYHHLVFAVSNYVLTGLLEQGITQTYPHPMLCSAELGERDKDDNRIISNSQYDWDKRKFRDRLLSIAEPLQRAITPTKTFVRRQGITLGIVSLLSPIKQFPQLFNSIAPILASAPEINLEIFGNGGYAMIRDINQSLSPISNRVRFWGMQHNIGAVYRQLDWLLSGLPEKEALGLNLIESQHCGTPVLAINAPPFTETVIQNSSGFLYTDPRMDDGKDFKSILTRIREGTRPDPRIEAKQHLARFSFASFAERISLSHHEIALNRPDL